MPSTVTPRIYTGAMPAVTNDLTYVIYAASDPLAEVASQTFAAPHPERAVSFPGLDRVNYIFKLLETNLGVPILQRAKFDFNPDNNDFEYRVPEIVVVGAAGGPVAGEASVVYDGTGGRADWRGWFPIIDSPILGPILEDGYQFDWDSVTGTWTITDMANPTFQDTTQYRVQFQPKTVERAPGVPGGRQWTEVKEITANVTLVAGDMGKKLLAKPATAKITVILPLLATVVQNRVSYCETVKQLLGTMFCVEWATQGADTFDDGSVVKRSLPGETFEFYKYAAFGDPATYRTQAEAPGMLNVGREFSSGLSSIVNAQMFDGSIGNVDKNARIWYEYVANLDPAQRVPYATWESTPALQTRWSGLNGDVPAKFHFPDRRGLTEKNTSDGGENTDPGLLEGQQLLEHRHVQDTASLDHLNGGSYGHTDANYQVGTYGGPVPAKRGITSRSIGIAQTTDVPIDGDENRVNSYLNNKFVQL